MGSFLTRSTRAVEGERILAYPVGYELDERARWGVGHPLLAPSGEVRNQHVFSQVQLWLVENPPTAGASVAELEGRHERGPGCGQRQRVETAGAWLEHQVTVEDLRDDVRRSREDVIVGSLLTRRLHREGG